MKQTQLIWNILLCMAIISHAEKKIIFTNIGCAVNSNILTKINCYLENKSTINLEITSNKTDVNSLVGISELNLFIHGRNKVMRLNGIRLDICQMLGSNKRQNLVTFLYKGILQTKKNLPKKCPFLRNTTYVLYDMKFDGNYLPYYLPEYNFTFEGLFHANDIKTFEIHVAGSFCEFNNDCTGYAEPKKRVTRNN
ncbi:uncharacterized protein LOC117575225 [Drosophila albomicans]|uniref:Uncharacterized protein LOC117575225 n=1 Tax=Drosophila albomicans TaxID=7291 RepID=A0A6P8XQA1_DROAB|nr:uncharacterized protein LOC117575225 [Drosophila albomicans]